MEFRYKTIITSCNEIHRRGHSVDLVACDHDRRVEIFLCEGFKYRGSHVTFGDNGGITSFITILVKERSK